MEFDTLSGGLRVQARWACGGAPATRVAVRVFGAEAERWQALTGRDGVAVFEGLPLGEVRVTVAGIHEEVTWVGVDAETELDVLLAPVRPRPAPHGAAGSS